MKRLLGGAALVVLWPLVLSRFGEDDVYLLLGPFALVVIAAVLFLGRSEAPALLPRSRRTFARDVGIGLGCGLVMTAGTYAAYAITERLVPQLAAHVGDLYRNAGSSSVALALGATTAAIVAEEMLWRGPLLRVLERRAGRLVAIAVSLVTYTLAQGGSHSGLVMLAALVCGAIWLAERILTRSMVAPLVSHLMWTLVVVHLVPVTRV
ncbi:MAG: hypothetical protein JWP97_6186 [Labilithrix sp.]|nr:hypothetical protein [Labilithrix sp.]